MLQSDGEFLAEVGTDAEKWADGFLERFPQGTSDRYTLVAWFANAIGVGESRYAYDAYQLLEALRLTVEYVGLQTLRPVEGWSWFDAWKSVDPEGLEAWLEKMPPC